MPVEVNKLYVSNALKNCFGTDLVSNPESANFLRAIAESGREIKYKANTLFTINEPEPAYLICTSGLMMLERVVLPDSRHVFGFIFPGTMIGLPNVQDERYRLKALVGSECIELNKRDIHQLFQRSPHISRMFLQVAERAIHYFLRHTVMLGKRTAVHRLADFLLQFHQCSGNDEQLYLPMSRRDISSLLGLSEETTSRAFSRLKAMGAIDIKSRYFIQIKDFALLNRVQFEAIE